jgi:hypothetical protein
MRPLPFKRTTAKRSSQTPQKPVGSPDTKDDNDEDSLTIFNKRSGNWFEEEQKRLDKEQAKKAQKRRLSKDGEINGFVDLEFSLQSDDDEGPKAGHNASPKRARSASIKSETTKREMKRRHSLLVSSEDDDSCEDIVPRKSSRKASTGSPNSMRRPSQSAVPARGPTPSSSRPINSRKAVVITLTDSDDDDEEDDDARSPTMSTPGKEPFSNGVKSRRQETPEEGIEQEAGDARRSPSEPPGAAKEPFMDELAARYVEEARQRQLLKRNSTLKDEKAKVLIDSPLDGTQGLIVTIRFAQKLGVVRNAWAQKQYRHHSLSEDEGRACFLTWRKMKLTDYTSLLGLGIKPDAKGRLHSGLNEEKDGYRSWDRVHFEAWTPQLWEEYEREQKREKQRQDSTDEASHPEPASSPVQRSPSIPRINLTLKSRDMPPLPFRALPDTHIRVLVMAFRQKMKLPTNKKISVVWDGEVLDPNSTVGEAEFEDGDAIEIYLQ